LAMAGLLPAQADDAPAPIAASQWLAASPHIPLGNGIITAVLYPPGDNAFYRGSRFDHAGVIGSLKLKGQEFYGPWFDTISDVRDFVWRDGKVSASFASATMGPAEEFDPVGYEAAAPGETFLLPGVGLLMRPPGTSPYDHFSQYQRASGSDSRSMSANNNSAVMRHTLSGGGFGYDYAKTLTLPPGRPQLIIAHTLRNTGQKPIVTNVYDHNFVILNPGQQDMTVTLPFAPPQPGPQSRLAAKGNVISWPQALGERQSGAMALSETPQPYDFTVTDTKTGASIRARCDRSASQYKLWSIKTVMAVEPYIALNVPSGGEERWTYTYTYNVP
jgi:hypothetical protein